MFLLLTGICGSVIAREHLAHCSDLHIIGWHIHEEDNNQHKGFHL